VGALARIVVVGSINMDIVNTIERHVRPGETIHSFGTSYSAGGKGANQAVAAARAGGDVILIGAVGSDEFAATLLSGLKRSGVGTDTVIRKPGHSGLAFINVDRRGENTIVLSRGANGEFAPADVEPFLGSFDGAAILLLQNEIPWETTVYAIREARDRRVQVWLNPAPARRLSSGELAMLDVLVLNETEAEHMTGVAVADEETARRAAGSLLAEGVPEVILTLGEQGCLYVSANGEREHVSALAVAAVDTTAAGDTFIGACAAACAAGKTMRDALHFASAAAALTVMRRGAQSSIPDRKEIQALLHGQRPESNDDR
jgi:ribokinase